MKRRLFLKAAVAAGIFGSVKIDLFSARAKILEAADSEPDGITWHFGQRDYDLMYQCSAEVGRGTDKHYRVACQMAAREFVRDQKESERMMKGFCILRMRKDGVIA